MESILITGTNFNKIRQETNKVKNKKIIFSSNNDDLNRQVLEKLPINILLLSQANRKDYQKQRNSGLNQVMAKIAKKNNIAIGINLDEIIKPNKKLKAEILSRIRQNIKLCNKSKLKMTFISKIQKKFHDLKSLGLSLGMPTSMLIKEK